MNFASSDRGGVDYEPCRYGNSRITFRGPKAACAGDFIAMIGGTETYGKFVPDPCSAQLGRATGLPVANFGIPNAGLDAFVHDPSILGIAAGARHSVVQVMGAQNMSNRFYSVHPRRNDRFVRASDTLMGLFPEIDFTDHAFTRSMLQALLDTAPDRFALVVAEVQAAWVARMKMILAEIGGAPVLLWAARDEPPEAATFAAGDTLSGDPLFVTRPMLEALRPRVRDIVVYTPSASARAAGTSGMVFSDFDASAAARMLGAEAHTEIAEALYPLLATVEAVAA
ncbi:hypothetical protein ROJ8625_03662 [Roseivivax jejudonensis]|uniref:DUF6473 domain-containing protein n=1 Tax=Roseivivax jejudonensis TaxID=1529041 RepID=A0A1X7A4H4_9RHOB|nr:DUF6473 family protein [Roseivivax jejudonensis]SLN69987.1 hypothetical protein ROJ8625_03662 [Roseivivax jejudonensis]